MSAAMHHAGRSDVKSAQDKSRSDDEPALSILDGTLFEKIAIDTVEAEHEYTAAECRKRMLLTTSLVSLDVE